MRRVVLLAILALALPTVALADTIDYGNSGLVTPIVGSPTAGSTITIVSTLDTIKDETTNTISLAPSGSQVTVVTGQLTATSKSNVFDFTGGTVDITSGSNTLFIGTFNSGEVIINSSNSFTITGTLNNGSAFNAEITGGGTVSGDTIVTPPAVPEPGTLGLLGTGLVGLAGMVRRKLRG